MIAISHWRASNVFMCAQLVDDSSVLSQLWYAFLASPRFLHYE